MLFFPDRLSNLHEYAGALVRAAPRALVVVMSGFVGLVGGGLYEDI